MSIWPYATPCPERRARNNMQRAFPTKKPGCPRLFYLANKDQNTQCFDPYAAVSQYPALNGLLMRSARGETSTSLSVGIFSPLSVVTETLAVAASVP